MISFLRESLMQVDRDTTFCGEASLRQILSLQQVKLIDTTRISRIQQSPMMMWIRVITPRICARAPKNCPHMIHRLVAIIPSFPRQPTSRMVKETRGQSLGLLMTTQLLSFFLKIQRKVSCPDEKRGVFDY